MACPSRLLPALLLLVAGCTLNVQQVEVGTRPDQAAYLSLEPGVADRGDILACLGPPDLVWYTRSDEVLEYRQGRHRGTDVRFLLSGLGDQVFVASLFRTLLGFLFPRSEPEELKAGDPASSATETATDQVSPISGATFLELHGRRLRWDVLRLTLDRDTLVLRHKEELRGIGSSALTETVRSAVLMDEGSPP